MRLLLRRAMACWGECKGVALETRTLLRVYSGRPGEGSGRKSGSCVRTQTQSCASHVEASQVVPHHLESHGTELYTHRDPGHLKVGGGATALHVTGEGWGLSALRTGVPPLHHRGGGSRAQWATAGARAEQGTWGSRTRKHREAGCGPPEDRGVWTAKAVKRPPQQPAQPPIRLLLGAADAQTAHPATFSTAPAHQLLGSANAETTPARAPAAAADRTQRPDATCEWKNG